MEKNRVIEFARRELVSCPASFSIQKIAQTMKEKNVGSVFITGKNEEFLGILTDRAIFSLIAEGKNPLDANPLELLERLFTVDEGQNVLDVLKIMKDKGLTRVGITDKNKKIVGVISRKKIESQQLHFLKEKLGITD
ncbi:MAG: CBS domain-containing protein [Promethearchaeota archaeon]